ncbi:MAG TPA: superoxide dismutase family protein [Thermoanaerobaculia bacterium]
MRSRTSSLLPLLAALMILPLAGCRPADEQEPVGDDLSTGTEIGLAPEPGLTTEPEATSATARLQGPDGADLGEVTFTQEVGGVRVTAHVQGLEGSGPHGFHVHENGVCEPPSFESAGGHFNPAGAEHACPPTTPRHAGDLGNVEIAEDGSGHLELTTDLLAFSGENSVIGKAVIVHGHVDDCTSQPTGDAGPRLACGVVEAGAGAAGALPGDEQGTPATTM